MKSPAPGSLSIWSRATTNAPDLPEHLYLSHENIRIFDRPVTYTQKIGDKTISLSGFPFTTEVREKFPALLGQTRYQDQEADWRYLCAHQTFEGAKVGPVDFTFREGTDNIPPRMGAGRFFCSAFRAYPQIPAVGSEPEWGSAEWSGDLPWLDRAHLACGTV